MDMKPLVSTFVLLFLAELGDKTQLACILQAAKFQRPWMVFAGAVLALAAVTGIGVAVGHVSGQFLPQETMRYVAGCLFVVMGVLIVLKVI